MHEPEIEKLDPAEIAYKGFGHIAADAKKLRDKLAENGAPQSSITRVNGLIFSAEVGEKNAATDFLTARAK